MKIISQIEEDVFTIKVEEFDTKKKSITIAHDYVQLSASGLIYTDISVKEPLAGKHVMCANALFVPMSVQMGIRGAQKILFPLLQSHEYMQSSHLEYKGKPTYNYCDDIIFYHKDRTNMVAIRLEGDIEYSHVTREFYNKVLKNKL